MTPTEALARFDPVIRRVVTDHHKMAARHGFEWEDMYQEACLAVFESLHGLGVAANPNGYTAEIVRRTMVAKFTYTPTSGAKPERIRHAQKGDDMGGDTTRAALPTVPIDEVEIADESLMPDRCLAEDESGSEDDMLALCEEALRVGNFTPDEQLCLQHLMHGRPSQNILERLWDCGPRAVDRRIEQAKSALSKAIAIAATRRG